jgi:hypothetical protein
VIAASVTIGSVSCAGCDDRPPGGRDVVGDQRREDVPVEREELDQDQPEEERRHRVEREGQRRCGVVGGAVAPDRLGDPERDRDQHREHQARARQVGAAAGVLRKQRADTLALLEGVAEVEVDQVVEVAEELDDQRAVVAVLAVPVLDRLQRRLRPEHGVDRAAGERVQQHERDRGDADRHDHGDHQAADDVTDHLLPRAVSAHPARRQPHPVCVTRGLPACAGSPFARHLPYPFFATSCSGTSTGRTACTGSSTGTPAPGRRSCC